MSFMSLLEPDYSRTEWAFFGSDGKVYTREEVESYLPPSHVRYEAKKVTPEELKRLRSRKSNPSKAGSVFAQMLSAAKATDVELAAWMEANRGGLIEVIQEKIDSQKDAPPTSNWVEIFDSLKPKQVVEVSATGVMGGGTKGYKPFRVGRRSHSKKYGVTSVTLLPMDGSKPSSMSKRALSKREGNDGEMYISASIGDMGLMLKGIRVAGGTTTPKPSAPKKTKRKSPLGIKTLEIVDSEGNTSYVEVPNSAKYLAGMSSDDRHKPALQGVVWLEGSTLRKDIWEKLFTEKPASVFVATDGHRLGLVASDQPAPKRGLRFSAKAWKDAFKGAKTATSVLQESAELEPAGLFPDYSAVLDLGSEAVYNFGPEAIGELLSSRPRGVLQSNAYIVLRPREVTYRYVPHGGDVYSGLYPYRHLDDVEILRPFKGIGGTTHEGYNIAYFADALDLAGGESISHGLSLESKGIGSATALFGKTGILAVLMPIRLEESGEVEASTPAGPVEVIGAKVPDTGATNKNPSRAAILRWLQKDLGWFRKSGALLGVGTVESQGRYERWIVAPGATFGAIRLPVGYDLSQGTSGTIQQPNQPLTGITYENLEGWMKVNWPSEAPIPAQEGDVGRELVQSIAGITNAGPPAKLVKGLDVVRGLGAFVHPERYGLEHVVLSNGTLEATDGHKGIQVTGLPYSEDDLDGRRNIGLNPGLFQGLPVYVSSSAWATSGHLLTVATENVDIPNLSAIINTDKAFKQIFELTGPLIQQILKKSSAKKGKGEPQLILSPDGFRIDYAEMGAGVLSKYRLHGSIPFLQSLKPQNLKKISGVNFKYFKEIIFAMSAKPGPITLNLRGELDPWTFTKWGSPDIAAVLMPMRHVGEYDEDEEA